MTNVTKFLIISNCQVQPIKHGLSEVCRNVEGDNIGVHIIPANEREKTFSKYIADKDKYRFVLSIPLSEDFGGLSSAEIEKSFHPTPVISISNLTYRGLHPDITYIGGLSARAPGPIGDYHSQIALMGFLMGLSVDETVKLYCDKVYAHMGYYNEFADSAAELQRRDENTTIPIGDDLMRYLGEGVCFLSHNHPTSLLLAPYINKIAAWLADKGYVELTGLTLRPEEMINFLAFSSGFPIYPELTEHHKLSFAGSYVFRTATVGDTPSKAFNLKEFVAGEFEAFSHADRKFLIESYPGNILMWKFGENEAFKTLVSEL